MKKLPPGYARATATGVSECRKLFKDRRIANACVRGVLRGVDLGRRINVKVSPYYSHGRRKRIRIIPEK